MDPNRMWKPAIIAGVSLGILSAVPPFSFFNCACCAWVIGGGILAAHLYIKASPVVVTLGSGLLLGLLTGGIGGVVSTIFNIPVQILMKNLLAKYAGQMTQMLSEIPNVPPALREMFQSASIGQMSVLTIVLSMFFNVIIYGLIAMLGAALGVAIFEKRKIEPQLPMYPPPPPPPPPVQIPPPE